MRRGTGVYVLSILVAINFLNYVDRYLPAAAAPAIQAEFHLKDAQIGLLATAFLIVYALGTIPMGLWADRGLRKAVIGTGVAIWSVATLFTGLARSFLQLAITRGVLGIGEASYFPAGSAVLGDLWPKHLRGRVFAFRDAGAAVGIAGGYIGGGIMTQAFGWRSAFFFTAIPGLLLAMLAFTMPEPRRGQSEAHGPGVITATEAGWAGFRRLWAGIPTLRSIILSELLLFWVLGALSIFLPLLIHRRYGLGVAGSATVGGGLLIAGGLVGTFLGGWLGDWRSRRSAGGHLQVGLIGFVFGAVFVILALISSGLLPFVIFGLLAAICLYLYSAPFTALIQNVVSPSMRASAITLSLVIAHLFGDAWSPTAIGALSDAIHNLPLALGLTCPPVLIGAAVLAATGIRSARRDATNMEEAWARHTAESPAPA